MSVGILIWMILFAGCTALFFGIALVVTVRGLGDLRDLLRSANHSERRP